MSAAKSLADSVGISKVLASDTNTKFAAASKQKSSKVLATFKALLGSQIISWRELSGPKDN